MEQSQALQEQEQQLITTHVYHMVRIFVRFKELPVELSVDSNVQFDAVDLRDVVCSVSSCCFLLPLLSSLSAIHQSCLI